MIGTLLAGVGKLLLPGAEKLLGSSRLWVLGAVIGIMVTFPADRFYRVANQLFWLGMAYVIGETVRHIVVAVFKYLEVAVGAKSNTRSLSSAQEEGTK